ncbi:hypothetical protein A8C32_09905 [Flavivirga aquatica]|uniref:Type VI secretion system transmembrane protein TssO n=1 Tax=Flavivirga aquatica TaxID=1849968 RepID=A0A1E5TEM2_9FLAO|nr:type VI secretion system TssO [Flavivirga aquatica]OEK09815.1 hypothetical protein A8C32_09905 [Flavivirga aquatica]
MKPLNYKERKAGLLQFILVFSMMIVIMFVTGFMTIKTGKQGVDVLEKKYTRYSDAFRKKAALSYEIEEIIKRLYQMNNKNRNLGQHKKFQDLVSNVRDRVVQGIEEEDSEEFVIYGEMVSVIKAIQGDLDTYKEGDEKYIYLEELLERCKEKYIEEQEKKNK